MANVLATDERQLSDGPKRLAFLAGIGCAFGGIIALTISDITRAYDPQAPWYYLKLTLDGQKELLSTMAVSIIALLFLEPLIEVMRGAGRRTGHIHEEHGLRGPRFFKWLMKAVLALTLFLLTMSHDAVRHYVDLDYLIRNRAAAFQLLAAVIIVAGTTLAWSFGTRWRLASVVGGIASVFLATATYLAYKQIEPYLLSNSEPLAARVFPEMKTRDNGIAEVRRLISKITGISEAEEVAPRSAKILVQPNKSADDVKKDITEIKTSSELKKGVSEESEVAPKTDPRALDKQRTPPGTKGMPFSLFAFLIPVSAWVPVGLFGGLILDCRWFGRPSRALAFGLVFMTVVCDLAMQIFLLREEGQTFSALQTIFWFGLGAGWAAGIFVLGPSADVMFSRPAKNIPARVLGRLSYWLRRAIGKPAEG